MRDPSLKGFSVRFDAINAEGQHLAFVPWEAVKPFLTPESQRIFGGARPESDADDPQ